MTSSARNDITHGNMVHRRCSPKDLRRLSGNTFTSIGAHASASYRQGKGLTVPWGFQGSLIVHRLCSPKGLSRPSGEHVQYHWDPCFRLLRQGKGLTVPWELQGPLIVHRRRSPKGLRRLSGNTFTSIGPYASASYYQGKGLTIPRGLQGPQSEQKITSSTVHCVGSYLHDDLPRSPIVFPNLSANLPFEFLASSPQAIARGKRRCSSNPEMSENKRHTWSLTDGAPLLPPAPSASASLHHAKNCVLRNKARTLRNDSRSLPMRCFNSPHARCPSPTLPLMRTSESFCTAAIYSETSA